MKTSKNVIPFQRIRILILRREIRKNIANKLFKKIYDSKALTKLVMVSGQSSCLFEPFMLLLRSNISATLKLLKIDYLVADMNDAFVAKLGRSINYSSVLEFIEFSDSVNSIVTQGYANFLSMMEPGSKNNIEFSFGSPLSAVDLLYIAKHSAGMLLNQKGSFTVTKTPKLPHLLRTDKHVCAARKLFSIVCKGKADFTLMHNRAFYNAYTSRNFSDFWSALVNKKARTE